MTIHRLNSTFIPSLFFCYEAFVFIFLFRLVTLKREYTEIVKFPIRSMIESPGERFEKKDRIIA